MKVTLEKFSLELNQNDSTAMISISPKAKDTIIIPRTITYDTKEYQIIGINDEAFKNNQHVKEIVFPKDSLIRTINKCAFSGTSIETLTLPSSLEKIGEGAFSECKSLRKITFDEGCKLKSIPKDCFSWSSIQFINFPDNVHLKEGWCNGTSELVQFSISQNNKTLGCIGNDFIVGKSKRNLNDYDLLYFARRDIEYAVIPSTIKRICSFAFHGCNQLKSIQFSNDSQLKYIDQYAFSWASLTKIDVPDNVKKIYQFAFSECPQLETVKFSENSKLQIIKEYAFSSSNLQHINIPAHVNQIGRHAFSWCKNLSDIVFAENSELSSLEKNVLHQTAIETINLPSQISLICEGAFSQCTNLKTINFAKDSKLKSIEMNAFAGSSLNKIIMPSNLENLKDGWCWGTSNSFCIEIQPENKNFKSVKNDFVIEKADNQIEEYDTIAFARKDLIFVFIPSQIKKIVAYAFDQCQKLRFVISEQPKFRINTELPPIKSSKSNDDDEKNKECRKIVLPQQVDEFAFRNCIHLQSIELLGDEVCIGEGAFSSCKDLFTASFPNACIFSVSVNSFSDTPKNFTLFVKSGAELVNN